MVKLFSRSLVLLAFIGLGAQQGILLGMHNNVSTAKGAPVVLTEEQKEVGKLKIKVEKYKLRKEVKAIEEEEWDEEVADRAKLLKGIIYGVAVPGTALINYNTGDFGINQICGLVMFVFLSYYGVIHAVIICLSKGYQYVKQIPVRQAINYIRRSNAAPVKKDLQKYLVLVSFLV